MAFDNNCTITGNVTRDPELRFSQGGTAIASFGLAWNKKRKDGEDQVHFFDVTAFGQLAENVAESVTKGMRVTIAGALDYSSWETDDGSKRSKVGVLADEVSPSLRWASASVTKNPRADGADHGPTPDEPDAPAVEEEPF